MARRKDLLSEAIADAKAVKETALANAKLALEEAFTPKLQSMISAKLAEDADEDEMDEELDSSDLGAGDNAQPSDDANDSSDIENDEELMVAEEDELEEDEIEEEDDMDEEEDMEAELDMDSEEEMGDDMDDMEADEEDELDLESVIAELEAEMEEDEAPADENYNEEEEMDEEEDMDEEEEIDLDEVIRTLKEMEEGDYNEEEEMDEEEDMDEDEDLAGELEEAYNTIASLKNTINEVNLLNAKLLYTNKLFRTFDLNENQKVKVLENFDRTSSVREVKLVFSTLAENLNVAKKKRTVVKEGYASKATKSSAPKKQIISEGNEMAARWKKLAGLK